VNRAERYGFLTVFAIAGAFAAVTIRYAFFVGTITDGSGYVSQATRWLRGDLFGSLPFIDWPAWPDLSFAVPLGYRLSAVAGTDVFIYPPGLPLVMAAAMTVGGELAAHLVPPLMGAALVWATSDLAGLLAGTKARVIGAALIATSAIALTMALQAFSDVPATAWWMVALVLALRHRPLASVAAGLAVTMAILTRPNLAPLALVPAAFVVTSSRSERLLHSGLFVCAASVGVAVLMWMQYFLYGSPIASGHPGIEQLFAVGHIRQNLLRYVRWYAEAHSPVLLLAALAPLIFWRSTNPGIQVNARHVAMGLSVFALGVYVSYLPYFPYSDWPFLRFMLPAIAPLYALTAAVLARAIDALPRVTQIPALALVLGLTAGFQTQQAYDKQITEHWKWSQRVLTAGRYLAEVLPRDAVIITFFHSGSMRHHAGCSILRPDLVPPDNADSVLALLERRGYRPYLLLDDELERPGFLQRFAGTRIGALDWAPRALIGTYGRLVLYDLGDREPYLQGERWPIDVLP
jgi:Dolichyl-phosphate-mannose-protein mannosyltransferase